ncbi:hypothetical protein [cf. Phormidesmis sp. LEGE 11477]|uniref:hypothetical protein n=1 Tax=cf. Phormidesmis sp. LEGE 11477 TaxID=1828680 RepID=UPI00187E41F8|nr:hypothetical protein [cf. Phormidesmis sp. LEGE 11477]MBE9064148.1 hypothetical protein [cf. Phormidesmis sp. LEGE 11477]
MTEFYNLPSIVPKQTDELLIIRDRKANRTTVAELQPADNGNAIAFSESPPTDKALWWQLSEGSPVAFWMLRPGGVWVSASTWHHTSTTDMLSSNKVFKYGNPLGDASIWLDYFSVRGRAGNDFVNGQKWRFELSLVNSQSQETPYHFLEVEGLSNSDYFSLSEWVGESISSADALAIWQRTIRINTAPRLPFVCLSTTYRKVWNAQS